MLHSDLIAYLACPVCNNNLRESEMGLRCDHCLREYPIRDGIPLLYPPQLDVRHLREEEKLARTMRRPRLGRRERFNFLQWQNSKHEFWKMVGENIGPPPKTFLNIGCGYDGHFTRFEQDGYTFFNFDLIYDILHNLQTEFGAKACVAGDVDSLPFRKRSFDYLICINVIHHQNDHIQTLLESFAELLKPRGILFLEDPNAWAMFQMAKSILLPRSLHRFIRSAYHNLRRSAHRPADYEFPTSVWRVRRILAKLGFCNIQIYPNKAYPCIGEIGYKIYSLLSFAFVRKYHNFHYTISAMR